MKDIFKELGSYIKSLNETKSILINNKQHLFADYPLKSFAILGSYARAEQTQESDTNLNCAIQGI